MNTIKRSAAALALWLFYVPMVYAQDLGKGQLDTIAGQAKIKNDATLPVIIGNLIKIFIGLLGIIFLLLTIYAGFLYLTARGEEDKVKHAKETLSRGVIGLLIISTAYAIASFVLAALTKTTATTTGP